MHPILKDSKYITDEQKSLLHSIEMVCGEFENIEEIKLIAAVAESRMSINKAKKFFYKKIILRLNMKRSEIMSKHYVLMHKDIPVLTVALTETNKIKEITEILSEEHKPINMQSDENQEAALSEFMKHRSIPNTRQNLSKILAAYKVNDSLELSIKSYQLSLSDHYWIKPIDDNISWNNINFFTNTFNNTPVFMTEQKQIDINLMTPNSSVNGSLRQMWIKENNEMILLKAGKTLNLEPFNEVFISNLLDQTNINHVRYELKQIDNNEYVSACKIFTTKDIEFVPAWYIAGKLNPKGSKYDALLKQCNKLNIPNYQKDLDSMIAIDYLTLNDDRHWGNFGFLRDSTTLEFKGMAPIFDNGNTLWYNQYKINEHKPFHTYEAQPFTTTHDKQIKYIQSDLSDINIKKIVEVAPSLMKEIYTKHEIVSPDRLKIMEHLFTKIALMLEKKLERLKTKNNERTAGRSM